MNYNGVCPCNAGRHRNTKACISGLTVLRAQCSWSNVMYIRDTGSILSQHTRRSAFILRRDMSDQSMMLAHLQRRIGLQYRTTTGIPAFRLEIGNATGRTK